MAAIHLPRTICIGGGAIAGLPEALAQAGLSRPLIVTDGWMATSGVLERVETLLANAGMTVRAFTGVVPDPTVASVEAASARTSPPVTTTAITPHLRTRLPSAERASIACISPGAILPAREQLGELLLELGRSEAALVEYEASLVRAPRRLAGLYGAARSAMGAGKTAKARGFFAQIVEQTSKADGRRAEVREARAALRTR